MPTILLLHGALGCQNSFDALKALLQPHFDVHTLDFVGHGTVPLPDVPISIQLFAQQVRAYCAAHFDNPVPIFGYSMGGYVGLYMARHYPSSVSQVYTLATKLHWTTAIAQKEAALLNADVIAQKVPKYAAILAQQHGQQWQNLVRHTANMLLDMGKEPPLQNTDFEQIAQPVRLSVGDRDTMVSIDETVATYRLLHNAQLFVMPQTPHPLDKVNMTALAREIIEVCQ